MSYLKEKFLSDVVAEAVNIKQNASTEEISKLDLNTIDPESYHSCIYGQMTGNCTSNRAHELIFKCAQRYVDMPKKGDYTFSRDGSLPTGKGFDAIQPFINGIKPDGVNDSFDLRVKRVSSRTVLEVFSAIEVYIMLPESNVKDLVSFIKGETETLAL